MATAAVPREDRSLRALLRDEPCKRPRSRGSATSTGKARFLEVPSLQAPALLQLLGAAKSTAPHRCSQPELLDGLDLALATVDPGRVTTQLILKAFEHMPGAHAQLQHVLGSEAGGGSTDPGRVAACASGEFLVVQAPGLQGSGAERRRAVHQLHTGHSGVPAGQSPKPSCGQPTDCGEATNDTPKPVASGFGATEPLAATPVEPAPNAGRAGPRPTADGEVEALRRHKEWADQKIDLLIRRVREAEGPHRLLKQEVQQLRQEKNTVESKLREFESSLRKLKECTHSEAVRHRETELGLRAAEAELRGSKLREQETVNQLRDAQAALRQEKRRRESLERQLKKSGEEKVEAMTSASEASASLSGLEKALEIAQQALQGKVVELQAANDTTLAAQQKADSAGRRTSGAEAELAAFAAASARQQAELRGTIGALTAQLDEARQAAAAASAMTGHAPSLYSHFDGPVLFEVEPRWLHGGLTGAMGPGAADAIPTAP